MADQEETEQTEQQDEQDEQDPQAAAGDEGVDEGGSSTLRSAAIGASRRTLAIRSAGVSPPG